MELVMIRSSSKLKKGEGKLWYYFKRRTQLTQSALVPEGDLQ